MIVLRTVSAAILVCALAACAEGGTGVTLPGTPVAVADSATQATQARHSVDATIRIAIPRRGRRWRVLVRGHYISAATRSIAIAITPSKGGTATKHNADLTPSTNPNCVGSPVVCTLTFALVPGKYAATFATYDGLLDRSGAPTGNELSANQSVTMNVVRGKNNNGIHVTLEGVPASVALVPSADSTITGSMAGGFTASKCGSATPTTESVSVLGIDAAGNYIMGPGAPAESLTSADSAIVTVTQSAGGFTLTHPISSTSQSPVVLTTSVTPPANSGGTKQSAGASVTIAGGTQICGVLTEYRVGAGPEPLGIAAGPDGALWFTENCGGGNPVSCPGFVGRITTSGTITVTQPPTFFSGPSGITAGADGAMWFTETSGNNIGRITTSQSITETAVTSHPGGIAAGLDGALWFTESANKIGRITTAGAITETVIPTAGSAPDGIAAGPDGALWFTEECGNSIGRITTAGTITEIPIPTSSSLPTGIAAGPDGALWFAEFGSGKIGRVTTGGAITETTIPAGGGAPVGITAGPDGALWFTEHSPSSIGRITTDGTITQTAIPISGAEPYGITSGPDGALWFTLPCENDEVDSAYIGRLQ